MKPYAVVTYCDDIRFEVQNKITLVGCYGGEMIVQVSPPFALPKFGVFIQMRLPMEKMLPIQVKMFMPEEPEPFFSQQVFDGEQEEYSDDQSFLEELKKIPDPMPKRIFNYPFIFSNLLIPRAGTLRVRVTHGTDSVFIDSLRINVSAQPDEVSKPAPA